jgi:hypothetical protein
VENKKCFDTVDARYKHEDHYHIYSVSTQGWIRGNKKQVFPTWVGPLATVTEAAKFFKSCLLKLSRVTLSQPNFVDNPSHLKRYGVLKLRQRSRYSDSATVWRMPGSAPYSSMRIFPTALDPAQPSIQLVNGVFLGGKAAGAWSYRHHHLVPKLRMRGAKPLTTPTWCNETDSRKLQYWEKRDRHTATFFRNNSHMDWTRTSAVKDYH